MGLKYWSPSELVMFMFHNELAYLSLFKKAADFLLGLSKSSINDLVASSIVLVDFNLLSQSWFSFNSFKTN